MRIRIFSRDISCVETGTTARMIADKTGLPVKGYNSGAFGWRPADWCEDCRGKIDLVIFFSDPLAAAT